MARSISCQRHMRCHLSTAVLMSSTAITGAVHAVWFASRDVKYFRAWWIVTVTYLLRLEARLSRVSCNSNRYVALYRKNVYILASTGMCKFSTRRCVLVWSWKTTIILLNTIKHFVILFETQCFLWDINYIFINIKINFRA